MADLLERLKAALADRYRIERELGSGRIATVYLAQDLKHERQVAVKVLRSELAAALGPERFHQEIKIAANLNHPHVLPLLDSGEADGFLYYVMPHVEGESLREKLAREGELPVAEAVRILRDVVDALSEAHEQGLIHRDIKPSGLQNDEAAQEDAPARRAPSHDAPSRASPHDNERTEAKFPRPPSAASCSHSPANYRYQPRSPVT